MGGSQRLLYLPEDNEASACLEALRRVAQPHSKSLPHITLRYSAKPMRESASSLYGELHVSDFVLDQVTSFDMTHIGQGLRTVVLLCDSEQLEHVSYRPDYPHSVFHITLYDGPESALAERLLETLRRQSWGLRLEMVLEQHASSAAAGEASSLSWQHGGWFTDLASEVYCAALETLNISTELVAHTDDERLLIATEISNRLHRSPAASPVPEAAHRDFLRLKEFAELGQLAFWSEQEIGELSPGHSQSNNAAKRNSTYITPPELSLEVVDEVLRWVETDDLVDFGDPAIGAGIFFAALRHRIGDDRINTARGVEIDMHSARRTQHRWRRTRLSVLVGDFLRVPPEEGSWSLLIANPPYKRSQLIGSEVDAIRQMLQVELGLKLSRRSDLYLYFMLRSHKWMAEEGIAAWVIPAEFQLTDYASSLREYLATKVQLLRIHTYDETDSQFDNALISTSVVVFRKRAPDKASQVFLTQGGSLKEPAQLRLESLETLSTRSRWNFNFLRSLDSVSISDRKVGEFFTIKRGIATGANSLFVLSADRLKELGVERQWVRPLFPRAKAIADGVLRSDAFGDPVPSSGMWLIDTAESLSEIRAASPVFADYLESIAIKAQNSALVRRRAPFYKQENREVPPIAFVYMAKSDVQPRNRFVANFSSAVVLNNYLGIYPKRQVAARLEADPGLLGLIHAELSSISLDSLIAEGRIYGNGLLKLEPKELGRVRMKESAFWGKFHDL